MSAELGRLIVGAADPAAVETFWRCVLGDEGFDRHLRIEPEREPKTVKNRVHLDVYVRDVASLLALGARLLDDYPPIRATLADVEGNEFCAFVDPDLEPGPPGRAFAVCTDSSRPAEVAAWWAARVGGRLGPGDDGVPRYLYGCAGWPELIWKFVEVHDERVALDRWRWSVAGGDGWFTDPDGNEVSSDRSEHPSG
jgi:glyoxalase superfamily protein